VLLLDLITGFSCLHRHPARAKVAQKPQTKYQSNQITLKSN